MNRRLDPYGRDATRRYQIPLKGWQVAQRVWSESNRDNLSVVAAGCAFFALFAIFPALSALISLYGLTADPTTVEQDFGILGGVVMLLAILYVPILFAFTGYSHDFELVVGVVRWPILALFVFSMLALLYRYGPCRRSAKWRWVSVGSLFATTLWLIASAAFSLYVSNFANYDRIYGSLGAVIILLFWLYISFYIVLLGAEINAELELQTAKDTTAALMAS